MLRVQTHYAPPSPDGRFGACQTLVRHEETVAPRPHPQDLPRASAGSADSPLPRIPRVPRRGRAVPPSLKGVGRDSGAETP